MTLDPTTAPAYPRGFVRRLPPPGTGEPAGRGVVTDAELEPLPAAARRYLRFMGVPGRPPARALWAQCTGWFRRGPTARPLSCRTWQYNRAVPVARWFRMRLRIGGLPMIGWDTYERGHGRMRGTVLGLPVVRGGGPLFDISEQVTWLNDAVLLAPSMLLQPAVRWTEGGERDSFAVELTDRGRTVRAEVLLDRHGGPRDFRTDDRYADLPGGPVRARWSTPVEGWTVQSGRRRFTRASAVWQLPGGPFRYASLTPTDVVLCP